MSGSADILVYFLQVHSFFVAVFILVEIVAMNEPGQPIFLLLENSHNQVPLSTE